MSQARLVANRYARAFSDALPDAAGFDTARQEVRALAELVSTHEELRHALANPVTGTASKGRIMAELSSRMELSSPTTRFVALLSRGDRLLLLPEIAEEVDDLSDQRAGIHEVEIRSAAPLGEPVRLRLSTALGEVAGGEVRISEKVDPDLLGGIVARIGTTVFDGSLKARLQMLHSKMTSGAAGGRAAG